MRKAVFCTAGVLSFLCLLAGCQTTVPVTYTQPARLNLNGIKRIAIDSDDAGVASSISQKLTATGKYTVVTAAELSQLRLWNFQRQATEVNSADMINAYTNNIASADSTYKGKVLRITAAVQEIQQSPSGSYFVRFEGVGNNAVAVFFDSSEIDKIRALNPGQAITIIGECLGRSLPDMTDTAQILQILGGGQPVNINQATFQIEAPAVDAIIFLKTDFSINDSSRQSREAATDANGRTITDAEGNIVYRNVTLYERVGTVNIDYQVVRVENNLPIGEGTKSKTSNKSSNKDQSQLPAVDIIRAQVIEEPLREFISEIVPTERTISITLAKEADNKEAKKEMGAADKLVKAKDYTGAAAAYGTVYDKHNNFAAGYNQAILTEVSSGTAAALGLMEAVAKAHPENSTAQTTLSDMQSRDSANKRAAAQLSE